MNDEDFMPARLRHPEISLGGLSLSASFGVGSATTAPPGYALITDSDGVPILDTDNQYFWEPA